MIVFKVPFRQFVPKHTSIYVVKCTQVILFLHRLIILTWYYLILKFGGGNVYELFYLLGLDSWLIIRLSYNKYQNIYFKKLN